MSERIETFVAEARDLVAMAIQAADAGTMEAAAEGSFEGMIPSYADLAAADAAEDSR